MNNDKSPSWNIYGDEEPDSTEYKPAPARPDFFTSYLAGRLASTERNFSSETESETEDDDDEEESDGQKIRKKRKFTGLLNEIFPKIVEPTPPRSEEKGQESQIVQSDTENETKLSMDVPEEAITFSAPLETPALEVEDSTLLADDIDVEQAQEKMETDTEDRPSELVENDDISISHTPETGFREITEHQEEVSVSDIDATPIAEALAIRMQELEARRNINTEPIVENSSSSSNETIIERRPVGAVLAFFGAEFLSRRRDRKLAKQIKTKSRESRAHINDLRREQLTQKRAQEALTAHQRKQGEKLAALQSTVFRQERGQIRSDGYRYDRQPTDRRSSPEDPVQYRSNEHRPKLQTNQHENKTERFSLPQLRGENIAHENRVGFIKPEFANYQRLNNADAQLEKVPARFNEAMPHISEHELLASKKNRRSQRLRPSSYAPGANSLESDLYQGEVSTSHSGAVGGSHVNHASAARSLMKSKYRQSVGAGVATALLILVLVFVVYLLR